MYRVDKEVAVTMDRAQAELQTGLGAAPIILSDQNHVSSHRFGDGRLRVQYSSREVLLSQYLSTLQNQ